MHADHSRDPAHDTTWIVALLAAAGLATAAMVTWQAMSRRQTTQQPVRPVRDAGRAQMAMPPRQWDIVDESADQSFPASDPPGTY
jgi:hypothetical protein